MCGIAGIVTLDGRPVAAEEIERLCGVLVHRGPDAQGTYLGLEAGLGMRRLSIIDLETGDQPVRNEDGTVWVVFNGEIYNFQELRRTLEARGHRFTTRTDTEVIVHLYEDEGPRCVERLRGMFGLAVWDERRRRLLLARDRLGIKPLYYAEVGGRLVFASEMKAILQLPEVERQIDWRAAGHLLAFLSTPPGQSIVAGVRKLEPAHYLIASPETGVRVERYWDVAFEPDRSRSEASFAEELRGRIEESVRLHLVSDVPVGAFLSGGIDSSAVVAAAARASDGPIRTFSVAFTDDDFSEAPWARAVATAFGTEHHELVVEPDAVSILDDLVWHLDEPFGDSSAIPTYLVSRLAAQHVKVVLTGDGGDELFAGYDRYVVERRERALDRVPAPVRRALGGLAGRLPEGMRGRNFLRHLSLTGAARYLDATTLFRAGEREALLAPAVLEAMAGYDPAAEVLLRLQARNGSWLSTLQAVDLSRYLPLDVLTKVDRMSMAHSLEVRVPLLDHPLVEFAATIPPELKLRGKTTKHILKRALSGVLPEAILHRPKQGFAIPLGRWFRGGLESFVRDLLLSPTCRARGVFNPAYLERLLTARQRGAGLGLELWTLVCFELWCRTFLDAGAGGAGAAVPAVQRRAS